MTDSRIESFRHSRSLDQEKRSPTSFDRSKFEKLSHKGTVPPSRTLHAAASVEGGLYVLGGEIPIRDARQDAQLLNDMYHFDIHQGLWTQLKQASSYENWPDKRKGHTLLPNKSQTTLYLFGGMGTTAQASGRKSARGRPSLLGKSTLDLDDDAATGSDLIYYHDVWAFDISSRQWKEIKVEGEKPTGRAFHSAVCAGEDTMLMFGGFGCHEDNDVWQFNFTSMTWSRLEVPEHSPRPSRRWRHICAFYGGNFYVFGGQIKSRVCDTAVWKFNIQTCNWSRIDVPQAIAASSPCARNDLAGCQFDNRWLIHGGNVGLTSSTMKTINLFHEFSFRSEKWRQLTALFPTSPTLEAHQCTLLFEGPYVASLILTNGGNLTGTPPHWPQGGWRLDFLAPTPSHGLSSKLEEMYLHPFVRDTILTLWRDLQRRESNELEIMDLKQKYSGLLTDHQNLQVKHEKLVKISDEAVASLEAVSAEADELKATLSNSHTARERLVQQVQDLQSMVENLEKQNEHRVQTVEHLEQSLAEAESARNKAKEELEWCREQNDKRIDEFEREIEAAKDRENDAIAHCDSIERELRRRGEVLEELDRKLGDADESNKDLVEENKRLLLELETSKAQWKAAESQLLQVQALHIEQTTQSTAELSQQQRVIDDLQNALDEKAQEVATLSTTVTNLETDLAATRQEHHRKMEEKDEAISRSEGLVKNLRLMEEQTKDQLEDVARAVHILEGKLSELEEDVESYRSKYLDQQKQAQDLGDALDICRDEKAECLSELQDLKHKLQDNDQQILLMNSELNAEAAAHKKTMKELQDLATQCLDLQDIEKVLKDAKEQLESEKASLLIEKETVSSECVIIRSQLGKTNQELVTALAAKNDLENALDATRTALNEELRDSRATNLRLKAEALDMQKELRNNIELIRRFRKYLDAGEPLKMQVANALRDEAPLSPASTIDFSDATP